MIDRFFDGAAYHRATAWGSAAWYVQHVAAGDEHIADDRMRQAVDEHDVGVQARCVPDWRSPARLRRAVMHRHDRRGGTRRRAAPVDRRRHMACGVCRALPGFGGALDSAAGGACRAAESPRNCASPAGCTARCSAAWYVQHVTAGDEHIADDRMRQAVDEHDVGVQARCEPTDDVGAAGGACRIGAHQRDCSGQ